MKKQHSHVFVWELANYEGGQAFRARSKNIYWKLDLFFIQNKNNCQHYVLFQRLKKRACLFGGAHG